VRAPADSQYRTGPAVDGSKDECGNYRYRQLLCSVWKPPPIGSLSCADAIDHLSPAQVAFADVLVRPGTLGLVPLIWTFRCQVADGAARILIGEWQRVKRLIGSQVFGIKLWHER